MARKHRVLIINAYFDPWRSATPTRWFIPRATAPYFLAGHFNPEQVEVKVWDEVFHGALLTETLFSWPDLVVFCGLTAMFDRAHQLSAYFRHANPAVVTAIGGPIPRALPALCAEIFDYVCQGDVEDIASVAEAVFGRDAVVDVAAPRYDLAKPTMGIGYLETTKYCNFACSFCSLTGEGRAYSAHSEESMDRQFKAMGKAIGIMVLDNNFYGNNKGSFERRVEMIGERWRAGQFRAWGALVTADLFKNPDNLALMSRNGCRAVFSGVESFDPAILRSYNKKQSMTADPQVMTRACADNKMFFDYGMMVDFSRQTIAEVDAQLNRVLEDPTTPLPGLLTLTIPLLGTPHFDVTAQAGKLMPNLILSDLDGQKLIEWPQDPIEKVVPFIADMLKFRGRKLALAKHAAKHAWHWRRQFDLDQTALAFVRPLHRFGGSVGFGSWRQMRQSMQEPPLTYNAQTDRLRLAYTPKVRMPAEFEKCFQPLQVTNAEGGLSEQLLKARAQPVAA